ncbi:hypothetical protein GCM10009629_40510 [Pseudonocardia alni]
MRDGDEREEELRPVNADDPMGTLLASPGVVHDERTGEVAATLTLALSRDIWAADPHRGAELVSVLVSAMLGRGWALLTETHPSAVRALPRPPGWSVEMPHPDGGITIGTAGEVLYAGDLGPAVPPGWVSAIRALDDQLAVCVATGVDLNRRDLADHLARAQPRAGRRRRPAGGTPRRRTGLGDRHGRHALSSRCAGTATLPLDRREGHGHMPGTDRHTPGQRVPERGADSCTRRPPPPRLSNEITCRVLSIMLSGRDRTRAGNAD